MSGKYLFCYNVPTTFLFDRGYTGHEHLDKFGLINMNGRIYDPTLARFLSPDPILQNPGYTQSHNRYSYCLNNPLKYTDPSGYSYKPDDWNKFGGVVSMTFGFGAGLFGRLGPGSGTHWSDAYRNEAGNYMLMSSITFNNMYGPGAADIASALAGNAYTLNQWRQGTISISSVRQAGGYWSQESFTEKYSGPATITGGGVDYAINPSGAGVLERWNSVKSTPSVSEDIKNILDAMNESLAAIGMAAGTVEEFTRTNAPARIAYYTLNGARTFISAGKVTGILFVAGKYTLIGGVVIDAALTLSGNQSWQKSLLNTGVGVSAIVVGGVPGIVLGVIYLGLDKAGAFDINMDIKSYTNPLNAADATFYKRTISIP